MDQKNFILEVLFFIIQYQVQCQVSDNEDTSSTNWLSSDLNAFLHELFETVSEGQLTNTYKEGEYQQDLIELDKAIEFWETEFSRNKLLISSSDADDIIAIKTDTESQWSNQIQVYSEIGRLRKVLLHRPGEEVENLTPDLIQKLLFDDIPYMKTARGEHDKFAQILRNRSIEVVYVENLVSEVIDTSHKIKLQFINQFLDECGITAENDKRTLIEFYLTFPTKQMVDKMIAGLKKSELQRQLESLYFLTTTDYPFICDPMPNVLFTRDPFASIGNGVSINSMATDSRRRETLFAEYIFNYHPEYNQVPLWHNRTQRSTIEGGDVLVLSKELLAIGLSQRTQSLAIEDLAKQLFDKFTSFNTILVFDIPNSRSYMHLDTVFTQIDYNIFTIHQNKAMTYTCYSLTKPLSRDQGIKIKLETGNIKKILEKHLKLKVKLVECGGADPVNGDREQWSDGANTLAIAPGEVIVYDRNYQTNKILREMGITVHEIPSSELSRGRGGPRCMSMPLIRDML